MTTSDDEEKVLEGEAALALARQGKDAWNAWAAKHDGYIVDLSQIDFNSEDNSTISFSDFQFPGQVFFFYSNFHNVDFTRAVFKGDAWFSNATFSELGIFHLTTFEGETRFHSTVFKERASFVGSQFHQETWFLDAAFNKGVVFMQAYFKKTANFSGTVFVGLTAWEHVQFDIVPDFRRTTFSLHVTLNEMKVKSTRHIDSDDADKFRRLKEIAAIAKDHDREQEFFAQELRAKLGHEVHGLSQLLYELYEVLSDYGRSVFQPSLFLLTTWWGFGAWYAMGFGKAKSVFDGMLYSASVLLPFLPGGKARSAALEKKLFDGQVPDGVFVLSMIEGALGLLFLFLIGLALRNRFRL